LPPKRPEQKLSRNPLVFLPDDQRNDQDQYPRSNAEKCHKLNHKLILTPDFLRASSTIVAQGDNGKILGNSAILNLYILQLAVIFLVLGDTTRGIFGACSKTPAGKKHQELVDT